MKPQEILLASALIALVSGIGAALATRAFQDVPVRAEGEPHPAQEPALASSAPVAEATRRELDELRLENSSLSARVSELEARLSEALSTRTPLASSRAQAAHSEELAGDEPSRRIQELTPDFVESVSLALDRIKAKEEAQREDKRKELQAQRIEERVAKMQQELGLNSRQASDMRSALIAQDDKREALFTSMRDGLGEPRDMRESFRTIRDETNATIQGFLTSEQFTAFQQSEEAEFGRRGFGDFGAGARPPEDPSRRPGR